MRVWYNFLLAVHAAIIYAAFATIHNPWWVVAVGINILCAANLLRNYPKR